MESDEGDEKVRRFSGLGYLVYTIAFAFVEYLYLPAFCGVIPGCPTPRINILFR